MPIVYFGCRNLSGRFYKAVPTAFTVSTNRETVKVLKDDGRKVVLIILEDELDENAPQLRKVLRSAANANHDLVFGFVGVKQWEEFTETFDV
jgi:protein disulfide-isomerase A1